MQTTTWPFQVRCYNTVRTSNINTPAEKSLLFIDSRNVGNDRKSVKNENDMPRTFREPVEDLVFLAVIYVLNAYHQLNVVMYCKNVCDKLLITISNFFCDEFEGAVIFCPTLLAI